LNEQPPIPDLLRAAAHFLAEKVVDRVAADAPLAFRLRVVAHVLEAAAAELEEGPAIVADRRENLERLLHRTGDLATLEAALARRLRGDPEISPDEDRRIRGCLMSGLRAELRLYAPRFDTRLHPESPRSAE
jgi:hypothetical protein